MAKTQKLNYKNFNANIVEYNSSLTIRNIFLLNTDLFVESTNMPCLNKFYFVYFVLLKVNRIVYLIFLFYANLNLFKAISKARFKYLYSLFNSFQGTYSKIISADSINGKILL